MKKEKNFSGTDFSEKDFSEKIEPSDKKALESLSDDEILQGFKDADARIVREYYYGYCRVAYCIYDKVECHLVDIVCISDDYILAPFDVVGVQ